jgi:hypothetical protein
MPADFNEAKRFCSDMYRAGVEVDRYIGVIICPEDAFYIRVVRFRNGSNGRGALNRHL